MDRNSRRVTIQEVARAAGVSKTTVSVVLNGRAGAVGIRQATREVVLATSERLGYRPNHAARSLRRRRTDVLTLLVQDLANPCFIDIAVAAGAAAEERGYEVKVVNAGTVGAELRALDRLRDEGSDGVIVATGRHESRLPAVELLRDLVRRGLPAVVLLDRSPGPGIPAIRVDVEHGARTAVQHLLRLGHERIAHLALQGDRPIADEQTSQGDRYRGYRRALEEAGVAFDAACIIRGSDTLGGGRAMMRELLSRSGPIPTATLVYNDLTAIGALRALAERGRRVPGEMAVVGTDGIELAEYTSPPLTTVEHPREELGAQAIATLFEMLGGSGPSAIEVVLPTRLVVRDSCGAAAEYRRTTPSDGKVIA